MITFLFLNQTLWCDPHWNRRSETIPMSGNIIGFGSEIRKLAFLKTIHFRPYLLPWFWAIEHGAFTLHKFPFLCQDLSKHTKKFTFRPWILTFFVKIPFTCETIRGTVLIFDIHVPFEKVLLLKSTLATDWPWPLTYLKGNLNLGYNLWAIKRSDFKLLMCLPCVKTFQTITSILTLWPWPLTYFCKTGSDSPVGGMQ